MAQIILVRHGQTDWNKEEIFRGRIDVRLNSLGISQAEAAAKALEDLPLEAIYSSPLSRALQTAEIIANFHKITPKIEEGFIDMDFGKWQGLSLKEVERQFKELYLKWATSPNLVKIPEGESLREVKARSYKALKKITSEHQDQTILIVAHRVVNKVLLCTILGLSLSHFWNIRQDTAALNTFEYLKEKWILLKFNDTCHLKSLLKKEEGKDF